MKMNQIEESAMMVIETIRKILSALRAWFAGTVLGRALWGNENYYINGADVHIVQRKGIKDAQ